MPTAPKTLRYKRAKRAPERRKNELNSAQRGYNWKWRRATAAWISEQFRNGNVRCALCGTLLDGRRKDIHVDHKIPPSRMGVAGSEAFRLWHEDQENWQLSCPRCNLSKQDR